MLRRVGEQWHRYRIPRHLARPYVSALAEEPDGTVWAGSVSEGLFHFKGGKLTAINVSSGISDIFVQSLLLDREGKLWVGTSAGLNRLRRGTLWVFGQNKGLGYGTVRGLAEISPGVILAGKPSDGLYRWNGWDFTRSASTNSPQTFLQVNSLLATKDGSCWIAAANGLMKINPVGSTGHWPVPSRDPPLGTGQTHELFRASISSSNVPPVPSGQWPDGSGGSPVLPILISEFALIGKNVISLAAGQAGTIFAGTREENCGVCRTVNGWRRLIMQSHILLPPSFKRRMARCGWARKKTGFIASRTERRCASTKAVGC